MRGNLRVSNRNIRPPVTRKGRAAGNPPARGIPGAGLLIFLLTVRAAAPAFCQQQEENGSVRWYRSNAGGMMLEEVPSRTAALRGEYALLFEYARPGALPDVLKPFYRTGYVIEVRALFSGGEESRRQWVFRDEKGTTRLAAAFYPKRNEPEPPPAAQESPAGEGGTENEIPPGEEESVPVEPVLSAPDPYDGRGAPGAFIEVYNENYLITGEHLFFDEGDEAVIEYFYSRGFLYKAEARWKITGGEKEEYKNIYTDSYRYNRSGSLRSAERIFHERAEALPVRLAFPNRVLDVSKENESPGGKLAAGSDFFGSIFVAEGYRIIYTTDNRGRIMTETLQDNDGSAVWVIKNTWSGDRIISALKTEGDDEWLVEYEYDSKGDRITERDLHNGVLERMVRAAGGGRDVEELYMNGRVILRATWDNGRKISEEQVRR
jgi:hypothetical protein